MATQTRLLSPGPRQGFHLDPRSKEAGRKGLAKARAALAETIARTHAEPGHPAPDEHHRHAA